VLKSNRKSGTAIVRFVVSAIFLPPVFGVGTSQASFIAVLGDRYK